MKNKRFSVEQIVAVLKQAELGLPVADLIRQMGISEQTFYRWKRQYAGLESDQVREFKQVTQENVRLKKLVAELSLDKAVLQDVNSPEFSRHLRVSSSAAFRTRRGTASRSSCAFVVDCRTSRCSRTRPALPLRVFCRFGVGCVRA